MPRPSSPQSEAVLPARSGARPLPDTPEQRATRDRLLRKVRRGLALGAAGILAVTAVTLTDSVDDVDVASSGAGAPIGGAAPGAGDIVAGETADPDGSDLGGAQTTVAADVSASAGGGAGGVPAEAGATASAASPGGRSRSGVTCAAGARQVPWSKYAPWCVPAFSGDNGGATSPGVTGATIRLSYRRQGSAQAATVRAIAGEATPSDDEYLHDLQVFANLFNANYELYGRQIELAPYDGKGDYLTEDLGQGQQAANADAITARELGAFADITFPSATSLFYSSGLQSQSVIAYGFPLAPQSWYERNSPWQYNVFLSGTAWAGWATNLVCQRLRTEVASFAGDPALATRSRVYGIVSVEFPTWLETADQIVGGIESRCGITMARRVTYAEDLGSMQQDASAIAAQMKSAGVTTVVCFCDPLMPIFLTDAASRQEYRPEWIVQNQYDPIAQVTDQSQYGHAIAPGPVQQAPSQSEAYAAYKLADPGGEPSSIYYAVAYEVLLHVFGVVQSAGPMLSPESFRSGAFALPPSVGPGEFGSWGSGPGHYTPTSGVGIVAWDPGARSANGKSGSWVPCDGGTTYPFADAVAWGAGPVACPR